MPVPNCNPIYARNTVGKRKSKKVATQPAAESYQHPQADVALRPDVGTQAQFRKKKPPATYRYDSSLSPSLEWDGENSARELGEWLLRQIEGGGRTGPTGRTGIQRRTGIQPVDAVPPVASGNRADDTGRMPVLPRHAFPTPREFKGADGKVLATVGRAPGCGGATQTALAAVPELGGQGRTDQLRRPHAPPVRPRAALDQGDHRNPEGAPPGQRNQTTIFDLFGDPQHSITDQVLGAYEFRDGWTNRMILGDSLVVMNSLLHYENLGGQVQMIYMDPPYGVKFGSNFQPFVRRRDVKHNDDDDMTREPEMVQAYRDTWELGLHSYLTYMRDRLLLARELLSPTGSIFVQISDENLHHVRELMDEVFGAENLCQRHYVQEDDELHPARCSRRSATTCFGTRRTWSDVKYRQLFDAKETRRSGCRDTVYVG